MQPTDIQSLSPSYRGHHFKSQSTYNAPSHPLLYRSQLHMHTHTHTHTHSILKTLSTHAYLYRVQLVVQLGLVIQKLLSELLLILLQLSLRGLHLLMRPAQCVPAERGREGGREVVFVIKSNTSTKQHNFLSEHKHLIHTLSSSYSSSKTISKRQWRHLSMNSIFNITN